MSNFCGIISKVVQNDTALTPELTFEQLEHLIVELGKENEEMKKDFERKAQAIAEKAILLSKNNELLCKLHEKTELLKQKIFKLEAELTTNQFQLEEIGKYAQVLEAQCSEKGEINFNNDRAVMLSLIESLNAEMLNANAEMDHSKACFEAENQTKKGNFEIIVSIMDQHLQALLNLETNLQVLSENYDDLEKNMQLTKDKAMKDSLFSQ